MVYDINGNEIGYNNLTKLEGVAQSTVIMPTSMTPVSGSSIVYPVNPCQRILIDGATGFVWLKTSVLSAVNVSDYFGGWCESDESGADLYAAPDCHYLMVAGVDVDVYSMEDYKDFSLQQHDLKSVAVYMTNKSIRYSYHFFVKNMYGGQYVGDLTGVAVDSERSYRTPAVFAYNIVDMITSGAIDLGLIGTTRYALVNQCKRYLKALVDAYPTWSGYWQSSLVMAYVASAAYRLQDELPSELYSSIQSMLVAESDILITKEIGTKWKDNIYFKFYWKDAEGHELVSGDSKSEEVAWYSNCLGMAALMCPESPNIAQYKKKFVEWCVISYSSPSDLESVDVINGYPLSELEGYNMTDDGIVINHNMIHPDYMTRSCHFIAIRAYMWAGVPIPKANIYNLGKLLDGYVNYEFTSAPYLGKYNVQPPYGAIIKDGSSDVYFPQGNDWGTVRFPCEAEFLTFAHAFGVQPRYDCTRAATLLLERTLSLQDRNPSGAIVNDTSENSYSSNMFITNCASAMISPFSIMWFLCKGVRISDDDWWNVQ